MLNMGSGVAQASTQVWLCYQNGGSKLDHPVRKKSSFA